MRKLLNSKYFKLGITLCAAFFGCLILWTLFKSADLIGAVNFLISILMPFLIGFVIAYLVNPIMMFFEKLFLKLFRGSKKSSKKLARALSVFISVFLAVAVVAIIIVIVVPQLVLSIQSLVANMPDYINNINGILDDFFKKNPTALTQIHAVLDNIKNGVAGYLSTIPAQIPNAIGAVSSGIAGAIGTVMNLLFGIIISFYVLYNKEKFISQAKKVIFSIFNLSFSKKIMSLLNETHKVFGGFITGMILDSFFIGILCFIGVSILRIPYAALIAVLIGITNLIPFFGPFIGAIPSAFITLIVDPIKAIWLVIFIIVLQQFDGNILKPKILGSKTGLNTFWVLFAILLGGGLFGVLGMFLGVPVFSIIYMLISRLINKHLKKKNLPTDTSCYLNTSQITSKQNK